MTRPERESTEQPLELPGLVRDRVKEGRAKAAATRARNAAQAEIAEHDPVVSVVLDVPMAHLDRTFDYAVPAAMSDDARPGVRVKVRFAGQEADGFIVARGSGTDHTGALTPLRRVVSSEPVLSEAILRLAATVAERYAGTRADVLRLAIPPRHATVEREPPETPAAPFVHDAEAAARAWAGHLHASAYLQHLANGGSPRAVWHAAPALAWPDLIAHAVAATVASGRGALVCVPDGRDVARVSAALGTVLGDGRHVTLTAESGPAQRYRDFLAVRRGAVPVVVGTRAAAFAPVHDLGLVVVWDDGDELLAEPRAPYPHAREVLLLRAEQEGAGALVGGWARTVEADQLLRAGWAHPIAPGRAESRKRVTVAVTGATDHDLERDPLARVTRIPREAHETIRAALAVGPVLLHTPRRGYASALACERCRMPARCSVCQGPLRLTGPARPPVCSWCDHVEDAWACRSCGAVGLRAPVVGAARTAEEVGRAFSGARVLTSGGERVLATVPDQPAIVVATPGAEPVAEGGYAAVLLLGTWLLLGHVGLRTEEEALRRWSNAVGLVRPGGRALLIGEPALPVVQALVRWAQPGFAGREADTRAEAHLPPASRLATVAGSAGAVDDALTLLRGPVGMEVLGPVRLDEGRAQGEEQWRAVVRAPRTRGAELSAALGELQRLRAARKLEPVRIQVDPAEI